MTKDTYTFGPFTLDVAEALLLRAGEPVPLSPKVFETLVFLVGRAGSLVTHDELMDALWPDTIVSPRNLTQNVFMLRQALGDGEGEARYLETVPRRGYRFVAPVRRCAPHAAEGAGLGAVAILPFAPEGADEELEALAEGLADRVADVLATVPGARVLSRALARQTAPRGDDPRAAAARLGADTLVLGRLRRSGDRLAFSAELVRAGDGTRICGLSGVESAGVVALGDAVEEALRERVPGAPPPRPAPVDADEELPATTNPAAREHAARLFLLGRHHWNKRPRDTQRGIECFRRAIDADPLFASPWAGLADSYATLGAWESGTVAPREAFPRAKAAAAKAAEIGAGGEAALPALAYAALHFDWDLAAAERLFKDAVAKLPGSGQAQHWYAHLLVTLGRFDEARAAGEKARELEPLDLVIDVHPAWHHWMAREPEAALASARHATELDPRNFWSPFFTGLACESLGKHEQAVASLGEALELSGGGDVMRAARAHALALAGRRAEARAEAEGLEAARASRYVSPYGIGVVHAALGDPDSAFRWLETALAERDAWLIYARLEPRLDALRGDARFDALAARVGVPAR